MIKLSIGTDDWIEVSEDVIADRYRELSAKRKGGTCAFTLEKITTLMRTVPITEEQAIDRAACIYGHMYAINEGGTDCSIKPGFAVAPAHLCESLDGRDPDSLYYYVAVDISEYDNVLYWLIDTALKRVGGVRRASRAKFYSWGYSTPIQLYNLTYSKVNIVGPDNSIILSVDPERYPATFAPDRKTVGYIMANSLDGKSVQIYVNSRKGGALNNIPPQEIGCGFIVSRMVQDELHRRYPYRNDTYVSTGTVRDEMGRVIGCASLTRD